MKRTKRMTIIILTGLCLGFLTGMLITSCVSKHPKCAAYDKCENNTECVK